MGEMMRSPKVDGKKGSIPSSHLNEEEPNEGLGTGMEARGKRFWSDRGFQNTISSFLSLNKL